MRIIWSPLSIERVTEIAKHIRRDDPSIAQLVVDAIFESVEKLSEFPESGAMNPEANRKDIRQLIVKNHRIIYRVESESVLILTVRHSRQLLEGDVIAEK